MERSQKVFVLCSHYEYEDYPAESYCEGVFNVREDAIKVKDHLFEKKKEEWLGEYGYNEEDIEVKTSDLVSSLFDTVGNISFVKYEVFEKVVE